MTYKIEHVETETWHRVIEDLESEGFEEVYRYGGFDAGIDYSRFDLKNPADGELVVFEWDNWTEGEIKGAPERLEALRGKYQLAELVEIDD
jgi:hypothetical protein